MSLTRLFAFSEVYDDINNGIPSTATTVGMRKGHGAGLRNVVFEINVAEPFVDWGNDDGTLEGPPSRTGTTSTASVAALLKERVRWANETLKGNVKAADAVAKGECVGVVAAVGPSRHAPRTAWLRAGARVTVVIVTCLDLIVTGAAVDPSIHDTVVRPRVFVNLRDMCAAMEKKISYRRVMSYVTVLGSLPKDQRPGTTRIWCRA